MSLPVRIPTTNPLLQALSSTNQVPVEQPSASPANIAQNALQAPASTVNTPIIPSPIPDPEAALNIQTVAGIALALPPSKPSLHDVLNEWGVKEHCTPFIIKKISDCIDYQHRILDLSNQGLDSLPDIFDYPQFAHLRELNINFNRLKELPPSIGKLAALQKLHSDRNHLTTLPDSIMELKDLQILNLSGNRFVTLPQSISMLQKLQVLNFGANKLTTLPEFIDRLRDLQELYLFDNELSTLPESIVMLRTLQELNLKGNKLTILPESIGQLTALRELNLNCNQLTTLPDSISMLKKLQVLCLTDNQFIALPQSISMLKALKELYLLNNKLTELPESIDELKALQKLYLNGNQLTALPESIDQLKHLQELELGFNQLSTLPQSIGKLKNLQQLTLFGNLFKEIPSFLKPLEGRLTICDLPFSEHPESLIEKICRLSDSKPPAVLALLHQPTTKVREKRLLKDWLERFDDTVPGKAHDRNLYKSIMRILELVSKDKTFAETFWNIIPEATTTCGDRVALSILDLDVARQLITLDPQKHLQVADFLKRGIWTYNLLKEIAIDKAVTLRKERTRFQEIELHLGYFIKLKDTLNLPITIKEMLFFKQSTLTKYDIIAAETHVLDQLNNEDAFINFLIEQDKWKETLKIKCPAKLDAIEESYAESEQEPAAALETYQAALKKLTRELLAKPETESVESIKRRKTKPAALEDKPTLQGAPEDDEDGRLKKELTKELLTKPETQSVESIKRRKTKPAALEINPTLEDRSKDEEDGRHKMVAPNPTQKS